MMEENKTPDNQEVSGIQPQGGETPPTPADQTAAPEAAVPPPAPQQPPAPVETPVGAAPVPPQAASPEAVPEEKRTAKHAKPPRDKRKVFAAFLVLFIIFAIAGYTYSNTPGFCGMCHELKVPFDTWKASTHRNVDCVECHSNPDLLSRVKGKFQKFYYIYAHVTDIYQKPIKIKSEINNSSCELCHTKSRVVSPGGDLIVPHEHHVNEIGLRCAQCHSNLHISVEETGKTTSSVTGAGFFHPLCWTNCHDGMHATNKCTACHTKKALPSTHNQADFGKEHGRKYSKDQDCAKCHGYTPDFCRDCHKKKPTNHSVGNFKGTHRIEIAAKGLSNCMACHAEDNICLRCHD